MSRIAVFTGSRSEYGLLVPVMRAIDAHPELELAVVSGDPEPGTPEFPIAAHVPIARENEGPGSTPRAIGRGTIELTQAFEELGPDAVVIYGDRFEAFAAMIAASQMGLAVAHLEGGDLTQGGTLDDVVRHAMSKLAHLHFPTNEDAAARLKALGEEPWRITTAGFPPIDLIRKGDFASPKEVADKLGVDVSAPIILFTQHPISTSPEDAGLEIEACMEALGRLVDEAQIILTHPNGDVGSAAIIEALERFVETHPGAVLRPTLGRHLYHGVLNVCGQGQGVCAGNSSSGLKETPAFHCPNVDIGPRQNGRLRALNVTHVDCKADAIEAALRKSLTDKAFRQAIREADNPYGKGDAGPTIARVLAGADLRAPELIQKQTLL